MLEQGLIALLTGNAALMSLVHQCLYPVLVPEGSAYPCLSYQVVSGGSEYALDGAAETWKRLQFDAWGLAYADVKNVQQALHAVLDGYTGVLPDGTRIKGAFRGLELDEFEQYGRVYRSLSEYVLQFVES